MPNVAQAQAASRRMSRGAAAAPLTVLSLGAGVQSTTLALMAARGEVEAPDCAIFADTQWEPRAVYAHLDWLRSPGVLPFPVRVVTAGDIRVSIRERRNTTGGRFAAIPWHGVNPDGSHALGRRQCSSEYKLEPIAREVRAILGKGPRERIARGSVRMLIGISVDEAHRMRAPSQRYIVNSYPLVERGMSRSDCLRWLAARGYPTPPKSACIGCPFHSDAEWRDMRDDRPAEFAEAVEYDAILRTGDKRGMRMVEYMHPLRVPLGDADVDARDAPDDRPSLFGNECLGVCGL